MSTAPVEVLRLLSDRRLRRLQRQSLRRALRFRRGGYYTLPLPYEETALRCAAELERRAGLSDPSATVTT